MSKEDIELAEDHVRLAEEIIFDEAKKSKKPMKEFEEAEFALEKAEAEIEDLMEE